MLRAKPLLPCLAPALALAALALAGCSTPADQARPRTGAPAQARLPPQALYAELFVDVQTRPVFPDSKTFVDMIPQGAPAEILAAYRAQKDGPGFDLVRFVAAHFREPPVPAASFHSEPDVPVAQHIRRLWGVLKRPPDDDVAPGSSLIPLRRPYVVPGGRFREIYYWDSYFTMLGLLADGRDDLCRGMLENFRDLIDAFGFIPNGNRTYYLGRSQPPFFALMLELWAQEHGTRAAARFLPALEREYAFWMEGEAGAAEPRHAAGHVVRMPDRSVLNRYFDALAEPRPEAFKEDVALADRAPPGRDRGEIFRDLRAAAESGWDFSSRWFRSPADRATIHTTEIAPVDLNALLWKTEQVLALLNREAGDDERARLFLRRAEQRAAAMQKFLWDDGRGVYRDYDFVAAQPTPVVSMATVVPLFVGLAPDPAASRVADYVRAHFLEAGGYVTTEAVTGEQWDAPNGWPPLQWMAFRGFENYGLDEIAATGRARWLALNERVFHATGRMVEKYNVVDLERAGGGGEYPLQDGFGWTNGVFRALAAEVPAPGPGGAVR